MQYFQVIHGRAMYTKPSLKTLSAYPRDQKVARLVRNWDDMANPLLTGNPIPPSAYDPRSEGIRKEAVRRLVTEGLRWVVLDQGAYNDEALGYIREQMGMYLQSETVFEEGNGVIVFELR